MPKAREHRLSGEPLAPLGTPRPLLASMVKTVTLVFMFYSFSITLTFCNKKYITLYPYPLSMTVLHLLVKFCLAWLLRCLLQWWRDTPRPELLWRPYINRVALTGVAGSLDIGLSNWSFEFISVSLYTMTKSSAVVFILLFAIAFRLEERRWSQIAVVLLIAAGLLLFTYKSTQFHAGGFLLVLLASFVSGARWTAAQVATQRAELNLANPVDMIYHVQPWMILALLPLAVAFEGVEVGTTANVFRADSAGAAMRTLGALTLGALLAFGLEFSEYLLIHHTSSLTLSVSGILKEICTIYLASRINSDPITLVNWIGMLICLCGIGLHCVLKVGRSGRLEIRGTRTITSLAKLVCYLIFLLVIANLLLGII